MVQCQGHRQFGFSTPKISGAVLRMEQLWQEFFSDPLQWWDNRYIKKSPKYPDFKHKATHEGLWIESCLNPPWVKAKMAVMVLGQIQSSHRLRSRMPECFSSGDNVTKLCREGRLKEALHILELMVQQNIQVPVNTYVSLMKGCARKKALAEGKRVHSLIVQSGLNSNIFLGSTLVFMYAKCGSVLDAREVFEAMPAHNVFSWTAVISAYADHGQGEEAINLFQQMQQTGVTPDKVAFLVVLKACARIAALEQGKQLHSDIVRSGFESNVTVGNSLVDLYAKCGCIENARQVFANMNERDVVSWNAMIGGYAQQGLGKEALAQYAQMKQEGVQPDNVTYVVLLKVCSSMASLEQGKQLHIHIIKSGLESDMIVGSALVDMYAKCGSIEHAREVFNKMSERDVVSWSAMITGYAQQGHGKEALALYEQMKQENVQPNNVTYVVLLNACASIAALEQGKQLHSNIIKGGFESDVIIGNTLIDMYVKCGCIADAREVFIKMGERDVVSWTAMIAGYAHQRLDKEALALYEQMKHEGVQPNRVTYMVLLNACASSATLEQGKHLHADIIRSGFESDVIIGNTLVDMYAKCGCIENAHEVFVKMKGQDMVSWNTLIAGYAQQGLGKEALALYEQMKKKGVPTNNVTFVILLKACASVAALELGKQLHCDIIRSGCELDVTVGSALIDMYGKCGSLEQARQVFNKMSERDVISWSVMIAGYVQQGLVEEAFALYEEMKQEGMQTNSVTCVILLKSCASIAALEQGKQLHYDIIRSGFESDVFVRNTLVAMYAKCGCIDDAREVFNKMNERDVVSWNAMIAGYSQQGLGKEALALYEQMKQDAVQPDNVTYVVLLNACATIVAPEQGKQLHSDIIRSGLESDVMVGNTLVSMYGKCGCMEEAHEVFNKMIERDVVSWNAMIAGYAQQGLGKEALALYEQMKQEAVQPDNVTYVVLLNACANFAALEQGKELHSDIIRSGFEPDVIVGNTLVDMYAKCGCIEDAREVFINMNERSVVSWNVMIAGYAQQGLGKEALTLLDQMQSKGMEPNEVTYASVLSACSHSNLVDEGRDLFDSLSKDHGVTPTMDHYNCMVDLLGRAGYLADAEDFIEKMPIQPNAVIWMTLLGAARKHGHLEIGKRAFDCVVKLDPENVAAYVLLSNIYAQQLAGEMR
ncbi:hypothetical protein O6H91_21G032400 [Diphasiastrum complanatum]|nr:hypothetical protein O6H91_21G032400 [Diphasiastrum complanatum]